MVHCTRPRDYRTVMLATYVFAWALVPFDRVFPVIGAVGP